MLKQRLKVLVQLREPDNKQTQQMVYGGGENQQGGWETTEVPHLIEPGTRGTDQGANGAEMQGFIPVIL